MPWARKHVIEAHWGPVTYHSFGVLDSKMTEPASSSRQNDPLAWSNCGALAGGICRHAAAHDGTSFLVLYAVWDSGGVATVADGVLLECARSRKACIDLLRAVELVGPVCAELALAARAPNLESSGFGLGQHVECSKGRYGGYTYPFDAGPIANLPL